jgi:hypothetical protein
VAEKIIESMPHDIRTVRRLRFKLLEDAENDFRELKCRRWIQKANTCNREASVLKKAMVLKGP